MRSNVILALVASASAARPFIDVADTGLEDWLTGSTNWTEGTLPALQDMRAIPDFEFAAKQVLEPEGWSFYRLAAGQEWSTFFKFLVRCRVIDKHDRLQEQPGRLEEGPVQAPFPAQCR